MIEESYVSFDTAKLLKEAGFEANLKTRHVEEEKDEWAFWDSGAKRSDYNYFDDTIACPTQALAARWLREEHHIFITIAPVIQGWVYDLFDLKKHQYILCNEGAMTESYEAAFETALQEAIKLIKKQ